MSSIKALILTGGKSSRLGMEKAFINYHRKPQVSHLHDLLRSLNLDVFISCNSGQVGQIKSIGRPIVDQHGFVGPMGGIYTAMSAYPDSDWLVVACDMPMVSKQTLQTLLNNNGMPSVITYKSVNKVIPEVLLTIYKKELLPMIRQAIESKNYSLQTLLKEVETQFILPQSEKELVNVNTKEDLAMIASLIKSGE